MYVFVFGVYNTVVIGRSWNDLKEYLQLTSDYLGIKENCTAIIYVHNLSYEFQFIRKLFTWSNVFASGPREPLKAQSEDGFIFKDSYALSGYSLAKTADHLSKYKVKKKVGDLDYRLLRNSKTELDIKEWEYVFNDGLVVLAFIQEEIERNNNRLDDIPLTKTGYVRRLMKKNCLHMGASHYKLGRNWDYINMIKSLTLNPEEYIELKEAFAGGHTHANVHNAGIILNNVTSYDFTSSYPAVMCSEKFPMSKGQRVKVKSLSDLKSLMKNYCVLMRVKLTDINSRDIGDNPLSLSKCWDSKNVKTDNGRIISADMIKTTWTELDYQIMESFYTWKSISVGSVYIYKKGYLPRPFMKTVLDLYQKKTTLKGIEDKKAEYLYSKEQLNSCYGMTVTDIVRPENIYNSETDTWETEQTELSKAIEKYNNDLERFMFYPWGIWITAYARRNLYSGIYALRKSGDYIYSDTDSIKCLNIEKHMMYFNDYNKRISEKIKIALSERNLDPALAEPKTIKGVSKPLGVWDFDGFYSSFKTLGAKRYISVQNGEIAITIAGVNKVKGAEFLKYKYKTSDHILKAFKPGLTFPGEYKADGTIKEGSGKNTLIYVDDSIQGMLIDYQGNKDAYLELSAVYMENTTYTLSLSEDFSNLIQQSFNVRNDAMN